MTNRELAEALRCSSTVHTEEVNCEGCPFEVKEDLPEDMKGKYPKDFLYQCDVDRISLMAADALANSETHVLALQKEIEGLRVELQAMRNAANGYKKMVPQWVSVEERFPDPEVWALCLLRRGGYEILQFDGTADEWRGQNPKTSYFPEAVAHWMPLPEPPEEDA